MKKIKRIAALLMTLLLLSGAFSCAQAASYSAKVFTAAMRVYAAPSTSARGLGALGQGKSFRVTAISGGWARVEYKGKIGYARLDDMIFSNRIPGVVTKNCVFNYITKASYRNKEYYSATMQAGVKVYVVGVHGSYLLVSNAGGSILGYIKSGNVRRL